MARKGKKVGSVSNVVFRYSDKNESNVVSYLHVPGAGTERGEEYFVELMKDKGRNGLEKIAGFTGRMKQSSDHLNMPASVLRSNNDIKPGRTVNVHLYEIVNEENSLLSDSTDVIARTEFLQRSTTSIYSRRASNYLREKDINKLKFRNVENGKEVVTDTHADYESDDDEHRVRMPTGAYDELDASPGDMVEVLAPEKTIEADAGLSQDEKIDEMYDMVSEMYEAYLSNKND